MLVPRSSFAARFGIASAGAEIPPPTQLREERRQFPQGSLARFPTGLRGWECGGRPNHCHPLSPGLRAEPGAPCLPAPAVCVCVCCNHTPL